MSAGAALIALSMTGAPPAYAAPGAQAPTSYFPSEASTTSTPTYATSRAAVTPSGVVNGQDYDHYCKAGWRSVTTMAGDTSGGRTGVTMQVNKRSNVAGLDGNNGLLYLNQWWNGTQSRPFFRVVWATDYATTNSKLTLRVGDNWQGGRTVNGQFVPYSTDPAVLASQIDIWAGASKFRTYDWSTYVLGLQNSPPYSTTDHYIAGPYTGVNTDLFTLNPNVVTTTAPNFNDPYYPSPDQYLPNIDANSAGSFANRVAYDPAAGTITIDLGAQPAGAMIVFGVTGRSVQGDTGATNEAFKLTADFTGDYVSTDPTNTVCYPTQVTWNKTDADNGEPLSGSEWQLAPTGDTAALTASVDVADATSTAGTDADTAAGAFDVTAGSSGGTLQPGTWNLAETKAPTGYATPTASAPVTLDFKHQSVALGAISNTNTAPVITAPPVTIEAGASFDPLDGVTASDVEDGDVTSKITVIDDGGFDPNTPGDYTVSYSVTDSAGKTTTQSRVITVTATSTPPTTSAPATGAPTSTPAAPSTSAPSVVARGEHLAQTGSDARLPAALAALLLVTGGAATYGARKRESR